MLCFTNPVKIRIFHVGKNSLEFKIDGRPFFKNIFVNDCVLEYYLHSNE